MPEVNTRKPFYFFKTLANSVFTFFVGSFSLLLMLFISLSVIFLNPLYNQFVFFLLLGLVFFLGSWKKYLKTYDKYLKKLNYEAFVATRNRLISWIAWTFNFYLMTCWFFLLLMGSTNGFWLKFPTSDGKSALIVSDQFSTKITGLVLWLVHAFCLFIFKVISYYWTNIFVFAHREFEKAKKKFRGGKK